MADRDLPRIPKPDHIDLLLQSLADEGLDDNVEAARLQQATERRAADLGLNVDALMEHDRLLARKSSLYPSPECLEPYEVESCLRGSLAPQRAAHLEECPACDALVRAATPSES